MTFHVLTPFLFIVIIFLSLSYTDGWSGTQKRHFLNIFLATPIPFYIMNVNTKEAKCDAAFQTEKFLDICKEAKDR